MQLTHAEQALRQAQQQVSDLQAQVSELQARLAVETDARADAKGEHTVSVEVLRAQSVALLVSGRASGVATEPESFRRFVLRELQSRGYLVKVFVCMPPIEDQSSGRNDSFLATAQAWPEAQGMHVHYQRWSNQFLRLEDCFNTSRSPPRARAAAARPGAR